MAKFRVTEKAGFWDGVHLHREGTVVEIEPKHYPVLLHVGLEGVEEEGRKEMVKRFGALATVTEPVLSNLNPNDKDDLRKLVEMTPHARVVEEAPKAGVAFRDA